MPVDFITFGGKDYPSFQAEGNAARWIIPLAQYYCKGDKGLDIGYSNKEWMFPGAVGIEPSIDQRYHAMNLPIFKKAVSGQEVGWDYIFSSHCLEHIKENWMTVLDYWLSNLKVGGILFLYLPHASQEYWHPKNNRKHVHLLSQSEIDWYLKSLGHKGFVSGPDYNSSFVVVYEKR